MAKKKQKQTSETVEFVVIMRVRDKVSQIPFAVGIDALEFPEIIEQQFSNCLVDLIEFNKKIQPDPNAK